MAPSSAVADTREKVERHLRDQPVGLAVDETGDFMVDVGPAIVWVRIVDWGTDRTLVHVWAVTNIGVGVNGELSRFLLEANAKWPVGGFRLVRRDGDTEVVIAHSLVGEYLNRAELEFAVAAVASATAQFAPQIRDRFGGSLFKEA